MFKLVLGIACLVMGLGGIVGAFTNKEKDPRTGQLKAREFGEALKVAAFAAVVALIGWGFLASHQGDVRAEAARVHAQQVAAAEAKVRAEKLAAEKARIAKAAAEAAAKAAAEKVEAQAATRAKVVSTQLASIVFSSPVKALHPHPQKFTYGMYYSYYPVPFADAVEIVHVDGHPDAWFLSVEVAEHPETTLRDVLGTTALNVLQEAPAATTYSVDGGPFKGTYATKALGLINIKSAAWFKARNETLF